MAFKKEKKCLISSFFFEGSETTYSYADSVKDNNNKTVSN